MWNIYIWNQAVMGKIPWHIYTMQETLWVRWVHGVYMKGGRWEIFNALATANWTIRKLCAVTVAFCQWICHSRYSIKEVYEQSLANQHKVHWRHLVWNRILIPKTRFLWLLVVRSGLKTKDKLHQLGVVVDNLCPLCGECPETQDHLFFRCPFSHSCVEAVQSWNGLTLKPIHRMDFRKRHIPKPSQHVLSALYVCTLYYIWKCRNEAVWCASMRSPKHVLLLIKHDIRQRFRALNIQDVVGVSFN